MKYIKEFESFEALNNIYTSEEYATPNVYMVKGEESEDPDEPIINHIAYDDGQTIIAIVNIETIQQSTQDVWTNFNRDSNGKNVIDFVYVDDILWNDLEKPLKLNQLSIGKHVIKMKMKDPETLGNGAPLFYGHSFFTDIKLPNCIKTIKSNTFIQIGGIKKIDIPNSVTKIENNAFCNCYDLEEFIVPNSVTDIGESAILGARNLKKLINSDNVTNLPFPSFSSLKSGSNYDKFTEIHIGNSITSLSSGFLNNASGITSIEIPDSVTSIGGGAFNNCYNLTSVIIGNSVTSIEGGAFQGCSKLTSVTIPDSVTSIGAAAFNNCSALTSINIPDSVTLIGDSAFQYCSALTSINIPKSVIEIKNYTFNGCRNLSSITISNGVTNIGNNAFNNCSVLTSIELPESVTSIGDYAFYYCSALTSINIPDNVTSIGDYAFYYCSKLTSIELPESVTSIGDYAFYYCSALTSINIPDNVTSIGDYAFYYCSKLTSIELPESVTSIGNNAFYNCSALTSINIPDNVTSIGDYAFYYCSSLTSINIPNNVTSIGTSTFNGCSSLTSVNIHNSITSIDSSAFSNCINLKTIFYDANISNIQLSNIFNVNNIEKITFGEHVTSLPKIGSAYNDNVELEIEILSNNITIIPDNTFSNCSTLKTLNIPDSVTSIGNSAFYYCSGLTFINIPDSVTSIGNNAFYNCRSLSIINISDSSNLEIIGMQAFYNCVSLTSINIPDSVTSIDYYAFYGVKLENLKYTLTNNTTLSYLGFDSYSNTLKSISFKNNLTSIPNNLCKDITSLESIEIPNSVTSIGSGAFKGCINVTSINLTLDNISSIGDFAFDEAHYNILENNIRTEILNINDLAFGLSMKLNTYSDNDLKQMYFTVTCLENNINIYWYQYATGTLSYSKDNGETWSVAAHKSYITGYAGDVILIKGEWTTNSYFGNGLGKLICRTSNNYVYGNIMSLIYGDDFADKTELGYGAFQRLFYYSDNRPNSIYNAKYLKLPATTIAGSAYEAMFSQCKYLIEGPSLEVSKFTGYASCSDMFKGCTSLKHVPGNNLRIDNSANSQDNQSVYSGMFNGCKSLTTVPQNYLPSTKLTHWCYRDMFKDCTSLTNAPELPAINLTTGCYMSMFNGCTSLITAPELPATTLTNDCYEGMFGNCTSLINAPELLAASLTNNCYAHMFANCSSLKYVKAMFTSIVTNTDTASLKNWLTNASKDGLLVASNTIWQTSTYYMPENWKIVRASNPIVWSSAEVNLLINNENEYNTPILYNPFNLQIIYTSSNNNVAEINEQGEITIKTYGSSIITANFVGNDTYSEYSTQYILNVNPIQWESLNYIESQSSNNKPQLINPLDLNVVYSSSDINVASFDVSGNLIYTGNGTTTLTATIGQGLSQISKTCELTIADEYCNINYNVISTSGSIECIASNNNMTYLIKDNGDHAGNKTFIAELTIKSTPCKLKFTITPNSTSTMYTVVGNLNSKYLSENSCLIKTSSSTTVEKIIDITGDSYIQIGYFNKDTGSYGSWPNPTSTITIEKVNE